MGSSSPAENAVMRVLLESPRAMTAREIAAKISYQPNTVGYSLRKLSSPYFGPVIYVAETRRSVHGPPSRAWAVCPGKREQVEGWLSRGR